MENADMTVVEVRRPFKTPDGGRTTKWVKKKLSEIADPAKGDYRCAYCQGRVRIHRQQVDHGPQDHVEHMTRQDSEICPGGIHFKGNPGMSTEPVD